MIKIILRAIAFALPIASFGEPPKVSSGIVVDNDGVTLYTFDRDTLSRQRACVGACATMWPAALTDPFDNASGELGLIASVY